MGKLTGPLLILAVAAVTFTAEGWLSAMGSADFETRVSYMFKANLALVPIATLLLYFWTNDVRHAGRWSSGTGVCGGRQRRVDLAPGGGLVLAALHELAWVEKEG